MGQTVVPLGQNFLEILEKCNNELYVFFKLMKVFLKDSMGQTALFHK